MEELRGDQEPDEQRNLEPGFRLGHLTVSCLYVPLYIFLIKKCFDDLHGKDMLGIMRGTEKKKNIGMEFK